MYIANHLRFSKTISKTEANSSKWLQSSEKERFHIQINNNDIGSWKIKTVGSKLFNDIALLLKLNRSIHTFRKDVEKIYLN